MIDRPQSDPVKVPLAPKSLGLWGNAMTVRRNVLEVIPAIATREPIISGTSGLRWHMVMDPAALRHILKERVEDYPKSVNTRLILSPAIGNSLLMAEGGTGAGSVVPQRRPLRSAMSRHLARS